jgi:hypothetical protein
MARYLFMENPRLLQGLSYFPLSAILKEVPLAKHVCRRALEALRTIEELYGRLSNWAHVDVTRAFAQQVLYVMYTAITYKLVLVRNRAVFDLVKELGHAAEDIVCSNRKSWIMDLETHLFWIDRLRHWDVIGRTSGKPCARVPSGNL